MSSAPHVYTLTSNLLAERTFEFSHWSPGKTQRASTESFQVGGKGINVSKMLTRLGLANTALCFTGGAPGAECEAWLHARFVNFRSFDTGRPTRTGTVVRAAGQPETTFLGPDVAPSRAAIAACADFLNAQPDGHLLALCGSIPGWDTADFDPLRDAVTRWNERGTLAVDTYGPPLKWFATRPAALVKINAAEFRTLHDALQPLSKSLAEITNRSPVEAWIVTDGPEPVWFATKTDAPANIAPPAVKEVSATGSGDVFFASVLRSLFIDRGPLREAVAAALPLAAANAAHPAIAEFP